MKELEQFKNKYLYAHYVGSRVTCSPAPTDTDLDILVFSENAEDFLESVKLEGFVTGSYVMPDGNPSDTGLFVSLKKKHLNLIVTNKPDFAKRFMAATSVCKKLNLLNKDDRIALFRAVLYSEVFAETVFNDSVDF